ncbi:MAG: hypothetical protein NTY48_00680 [Candidatus Diapherotrites archaeon]|nr:hypothetical protein [Candidatus Diapherotrites archaeon]
MNTKRDKVSIIHDILLFIRSKDGEAGPTHIMYKANLSHQMLTDYINEMIQKEFIVEKLDKRGKRTYAVADKGHGFIKDYQQIKKFFDSYGL